MHLLMFQRENWQNISHWFTGFLGVNSHYLTKDWKREKITIGVPPFTEAHTSENILKLVISLLQEREFLWKTGVGLRDNASVMKKIFNLSDCQMVGIGCLIHSLQLCLEENFLCLPTIKTLVEKCRDALVNMRAVGFACNLSRSWRHIGKWTGCRNVDGLIRNVNTYYVIFRLTYWVT